MAKKKELCTPIMRQFMAGEVKKEYLCIVDGICGRNVGESFTVDAPIQRHDTVRFLREVGASKEDSKPAQTLYTVLDKSWNKEMSLLRAAPQTGRTHQIRLHAKECSLPIVGDDLYNPKEYVDILLLDLPESPSGIRCIFIANYCRANIYAPFSCENAFSQA